MSKVCGFIATIRSTPPRAPRWPASVTRTSYQVGRPWMFDGKMLRGETGTPMRMIERANSSLALAEPEPLTLANRTTKSFTLWIGMADVRVSHFDEVFLHVPCAGRAALGAQPAVQADVLVLHHHAAGLQVVGDVKVLGQFCAGAFSRVRSSASSPLAVKVMQSIGQMSTQASHSMQSWPVNTVCTSQFRQRCASLQASLSS